MAEVSTSLKAFRIHIDGIVQGVGFRPFIYRLARRLNINGWVINRNDGVIMHIQGEAFEVDRFLSLIKERSPAAASISSFDLRAVMPDKYKRFTIKRSQILSGRITGISPDIAVCDECMEDLKTQPHRIAYPLVNCTNCGPRFSIISALPYDRIHTSMDHFVMCALCEQEYLDPENRRFHAQPVACNECGPVYRTETVAVYPGELDSKENEEKKKKKVYRGCNLQVRENAIDFEIICRIIEGGGVAAIKGTGGYNLVCDAVNQKSVERIRSIKGRERKPFAIMFRNIEMVRQYCLTDEKEMELLQSWRRPVVLLRKLITSDKRKKSSGTDDIISSSVDGGLNTVGAILPYMPFHYLLFDKLKVHALVFTSANLSGDSIVSDDDEIRSLFGEKTDILVWYNRKIINPVDDSVCRLSAGNIQILRRARGYVPEMIRMPFNTEGIFASGSDLKNTFAIGKGNYAVLSQHIGDLENYNTLCRYRKSIERFSSIFNFEPALAVCDLHPGFYSAKYAAVMAEETGSTLLKVQHHHAHIASCMAEHGIVDPVIGICFDGTGFGDDGNIWGSEFMICDYTFYDRKVHFSYIPLPGGDAAIKEPWRIALSYLRATGHRDTDKWIKNTLFEMPYERIDTVERMITGKINSPFSCSAGRLFDAVAALTGLCIEANYDGEAPMLLESICCTETREKYEFSTDSLNVIDQVMFDLKRKVAPEVISARFHNGLAIYVKNTALSLYASTGINKIVLSGGVFQNSYLLNKVVHLLGKERLEIFTNRKVPVNDGGLALGQLAIAAQKTI